MTERKEKLAARLDKVCKNIEDTKRLIAYHKKMLKIYQRKETELCDRLEKEQLSDLFKTVKDKGCDIEAINTAINNGEFSAENTSESSVEDRKMYHNADDRKMKGEDNN